MRILLAIALIIQYLVLSGQDLAVQISHFTKSAGLNQSSVNTIFQDHQDMLWIGNFGGVNTFNGYEFESFENEFGDSTSVSDNSIWRIYEDSKHQLWVGTKASLSLFDRQSKTFKNYYVDANEQDESILAVKAIFENSNGDLIVGTEGKGIYKLDQMSKQFIQNASVPGNLKINDIEEDNQNRLWIATENNGLFIMDGQNTFTFLKGETIWDLEYQNDKMWVACDTRGLVKFETKNELNESAGDLRFGPKIKVIKADKNDKLWIGSATEGLAIFHYKINHIQQFKHQSYQENSIADNDVSDIVLGSNGVVFVGFYMKGFDKLITNQFTNIQHDPLDKNSLSHDNAYSMFMDENDKLWIGTFGGGLNILDTRTMTIDQFRNDPDNKESISHDWIRVFLKDGNKMWIGTWGGGLNLMDIDSRKFKRYYPDPDDPNSLNLNIVTALYKDSRNNIWVGTYGGGINIYNHEKDNFISIQHEPGNSLSLSDDHITSFLEDPTGIWICTYGGGINRYNYETGIFEHFLPDQNNPHSLNTYKILHMYPADGDSYWVTTLGGGLNRFYPKENKFNHYTTKEGLSNNSTMGMLQAPDGNYWISTNMGLSLFNPQDHTFSNFTMKDGLASDDYNLEAYAKDSKGNFYFGGKNGITVFDPSKIKPQSTFPKVMIQQVKLENEIFDFQNKNLSFSYGKRISIDFAALNPARNSNVEYAYYLKGLNSDWQFLGQQRHLEFNTLQPGTYTLQIKSTNSSKIWNNEFHSISFDIPPPWYQTWLFRIGVGIFVLLTGLSIYLRRVFKLQKQNRLLEETVTARTKTIVEKNEALEVAYGKLKELERFKGSMVHMIAYDLKNPLVSIINRSSKAPTSDNMQTIRRSGYSILQLIENMLDIQKFESADFPLQLTNCNLHKIVENVVSELDSLAEEKSIKVTNSIPSNTGVQVDSKLLERVIGNLHSNALKYTPPQGEVHLSCELEAGWIAVSIRDTGDGIPEESIPSIFDHYTQASAKSLGAAGSTGLGLSFCKLAIEKHGGTIQIESTIGKGTTVKFTVPPAQGDFVSESNNGTVSTGQQLLMEPEDWELILSYSDQISALDVYSTGEWFGILDELEAKGSSPVKMFCRKIKNILAHYDEVGLESLKEDIHKKVVL